MNSRKGTIVSELVGNKAIDWCRWWTKSEYYFVWSNRIPVILPL